MSGWRRQVDSRKRPRCCGHRRSRRRAGARAPTARRRADGSPSAAGRAAAGRRAARGCRRPARRPRAFASDTWPASSTKSTSSEPAISVARPDPGRGAGDVDLAVRERIAHVVVARPAAGARRRSDRSPCAGFWPIRTAHAALLRLLGDLVEQVADDLVAVGGDADPPPAPDEVDDELGPGGGLAGPGRPLDGEVRVVEQRREPAQRRRRRARPGRRRAGRAAPRVRIRGRRTGPRRTGAAGAAGCRAPRGTAPSASIPFVGDPLPDPQQALALLRRADDLPRHERPWVRQLLLLRPALQLDPALDVVHVDDLARRLARDGSCTSVPASMSCSCSGKR